MEINLKENIGFNKTIVIPLTIINKNFTTDMNNNLTLTSIENTTSLKFSNYTMLYIHNLNLTNPLNISTSNSKDFNITIFINTVNTSNKVGIYEDTLKLISSNGLPSKNFTILLKVNLTNEILVDASINGTIEPNKEFNFTVIPRYQNGSFVDELNTSNFTLEFEKEYITGRFYRFNATIINVSKNGESYLIFANVSNVLGGNFTAKIKVLDGRGNEGLKILKDIPINESFLLLDAYPETSEFHASTQIYIIVRVSNVGIKKESNVEIRTSSQNCNVYRSPLNISEINGSSTYTNNTAFLVATQNGTNCIVSVYSNNPKFHPAHKNITFTIYWSPPPSSSTSETQQNQTSQQQNVSFELTFVNLPNVIEVNRNSSKTISIFVKNPSSTAQDVKLLISGINESYYQITPSLQRIYSNKTSEFVVEFKDIDTKIGKYEIEVFAVSDYTNISSQITLIVNPSLSEISQLEENLNSLESVIKELESNITQLEKTGANLTALKNLISEIKSNLAELKTKLENKEYVDVYYSIGDLSSKVENLLTSIKNVKSAIESKKEGEKKELSIFDIVIIAIIIAAIAFLIYLLLPVKT